MPRTSTIAISAGFIITGSVACALTGPLLVKNKNLDVPLNVMGINRSPYGEVFAMAMQSPIDDYFHASTNGHIHSHAPGEDHDHSDHDHSDHDHSDHDHSDHDHSDHDHSDHDHDHDHSDHDHSDHDHSDHDHSDHDHSDHDHGDEGHCDHCDHDREPKEKNATAPSSLKGRYRSLLISLSKVRAIRTNPRPASPKFKFHLRRQTENKLRFAYQLDPSHYANYNALHFFLTEPQFGTRPELTPSAAALAHETVNYCLKRTDDPRPALTAAAACTNILHLMFADRNTGSTRHSTAEMRNVLQLLDFSIARYETIAREWEANGLWKNLSTQRTQECLERYEFILRIRKAAETAILYHENPPSSTPKTN